MPSTKIFIGDEAMHFLQAREFVRNWHALASDTPGFTRLQEPEFVISWYNTYSVEYTPVLCVWLESVHTPIALMCLAWDNKLQVLTHAGHKNAEYHGWLAKPEVETQFLCETVELLKKQYRLKYWHWGWLPPGIGEHPLRNLKVPGVRLLVDQRNSLVWDLTNVKKLQGVQKSKSIKSKRNQLRRRGELKFRVIDNEKELTAIMETVRLQCDFRLEALYDVRPYEDDPKKSSFEVALLGHPGLAHASGLWLADKLIAFHLGVADERRVCLGVISFDPTESKSSPGTLLMIELGASLSQKGFEIFDLTPGKDLYKERFANDAQRLYRPSFYFSTQSFLRIRSRKLVQESFKKIMTVVGFSRKRIKSWMISSKQWKRRLEHLGLMNMFRNFVQGVFLTKDVYVYYLPGIPHITSSERTFTIRKDRFWDLLQYDKNTPWALRRDLLREASSRFSRGERLLSATKHASLVWHCWYTEDRDSLKIPACSNAIQLPEKAAVLEGFYCPDLQKFEEYLERTLLCLGHHNGPIYIILDLPKKLSQERTSEWNARVVNKLSCVQLLWAFKLLRAANP